MQVVSAEAPALGGSAAGVALKVTDLPPSVHDARPLVDAFAEVSLLQAFRCSPSVCQVPPPPPPFLWPDSGLASCRVCDCTQTGSALRMHTA